MNKSHLFFAGSTKKSIIQGKEKSNGIIVACDFTRDMEFKAEFIFDGERIQAVTCLTRLKGRDELVIGGFRDLFICKFLGDSFEILTKFKDVHTGMYRL